jgi:hypothetical protein
MKLTNYFLYDDESNKLIEHNKRKILCIQRIYDNEIHLKTIYIYLIIKINYVHVSSDEPNASLPSCSLIFTKQQFSQNYRSSDYKPSFFVHALINHTDNSSICFSLNQINIYLRKYYKVHSL